MELLTFDNYEELSKSAAYKIINKVKEKTNAIIGFATGSSPLGLYYNLVEDYNKNKTSYKNITTFNLDEYLGIETSNNQSYYYYMFDNLFNKIDVKKENINMPSSDLKNIKTECINYSNKLKDNKRDIQILGVGSNGHIGFNEPNTKKDSKTHIVKLKKSTIKANSRFFDNSIKKTPKKAITMGISEILDAEEIIVIFKGEDKKKVFDIFLEGKVNKKYPITYLLEHDNVSVYVSKDFLKK